MSENSVCFVDDNGAEIEVIWIEARPLSVPIRFVPQESHSQAGSTRLRHKLKKNLIVALAAVGEQIMIITLPLQYVLP